jgi:regulator of protease activity HflC (stomatin/prohibitin superfamily)
MSSQGGAVRLVLDPRGSSIRWVAVVLMIGYFALLGGGVVWITLASRLRFMGFSAGGTILLAYLIAAFASALLLLLVAWITYFRQRAIAIQRGWPHIPVLFGLGELHLWHPGETLIFLRNKRESYTGDQQGGTQITFPMFGEEAMGPISMKTELLPWTDPHVLTREAQPVEIETGIWWRVEDPGRYAFKIASEIQVDAGENTRRFSGQKTLGSENVVIDPHKVAANWLKVWVGSSIRGYVNRLGIADVISVQATRWLRLPADAPEGGSESSFERLVEPVLEDVRGKAREFGIAVERIAVQGIKLPARIQEVINRTREAFMLPIQSEQESEARYIALKRELEASRDVLGDQTFQLNQLLSNFRGSNFGAFPQFLQGLFSMVDQKAASVPPGGQLAAQLPPSVPSADKAKLPT